MIAVKIILLQLFKFSNGIVINSILDSQAHGIDNIMIKNNTDYLML